jgi:hypothetical protein
MDKLLRSLPINKGVRLREMNKFRETAITTIRELTDQIANPPTWEESKDCNTVVIPKQNADGIELKFELYDYGVYPYIENHCGSPWDVTVFELDDLQRSVTEFLNSFFHDATLEVQYDSQGPFKWSYKYSFEGDRVEESWAKRLRTQGHVFVRRCSNWG